MRKRDFLALVVSAASWPLAARAERRIARIGYLSPAYAGTEKTSRGLATFRAGLADLGYVEGRDFEFAFRWWAKESEEKELARELVDLKVDVIVTSADGVLAAHEVTKTVPIVAAITLDVVAKGLADSLAHPGGNVTGETFFVDELSVKRLAFLKQVKPAMTRVGLLVLPLSPFVPSALDAAAKALGVAVEPIEVTDPGDCDRAFSAGPDASVDGLLVSDPPEFVIGAGPAAIAAAAQSRGLPTAGAISIAKGGGLLGYGVDYYPMFRRAAVIVDKILKGARTGDIPIEQATKFVTVVNLKTAKALGLEIPPTLLAAADEVIE